MNTAEILSSLISHSLTVLLVITSLGSLIFFGLAVRRLTRSRRLSACLHASIALIFALLAVLVAGIAANIYTYQRLTYEQPVADLSFRKIADRHFMVRIQQPDSGSMVYDLRGDQWQLDARVLKWQGLATLLGYDAMYRLERISGRYINTDAEMTQRRTVYDLTGTDNKGVDLWQWIQGHEHLLPWLDAIYGSAAYLPMQDGAHYRVTLTQSGLIARQSDG